MPPGKYIDALRCLRVASYNEPDRCACDFKYKFLHLMVIYYLSYSDGIYQWLIQYKLIPHPF